MDHRTYRNWKGNMDVVLEATSKGQKYLFIFFYPLLHVQKEEKLLNRTEIHTEIFCLSDVAHTFLTAWAIRCSDSNEKYRSD